MTAALWTDSYYSQKAFIGKYVKTNVMDVKSLPCLVIEEPWQKVTTMSALKYFLQNRTQSYPPDKALRENVCFYMCVSVCLVIFQGFNTKANLMSEGV